MRSAGGWSSWTEINEGSWTADRSAHEYRLVKVRDYKDKFVLDHLLEGARNENPGFRRYEHGRQDAVLAWDDIEEGMRPVGYWIETLQHPGRSYLEHRSYWFPNVLSQVYVVKNARRKGIATALVNNYLASHPGTIWVESPKWETRSILSKLGLAETDERYETWQMMEGLTKWQRTNDRT